MRRSRIMDYDVPQPTRVIANVLARIFGDILVERSIVPDLKGRYTFSVSKRKLLADLPDGKLTTGIRTILRKDFGYSLHEYRGQFQVTKFR